MTRRPRLLALLAGLALGGCSVSEYFVTGAPPATAGTDTSEPDPCLNGVQEPWESDVDCGGPICEPCGVDQGCKVDADCTTAICAQGVCSDDPCEVDDPCPFVDAPCLAMSCDPEQGCLLEALPDGDPCGPDGPDVPPPIDAGICLDGLCLAPCGPCDHLDGPCRAGVCDPLSGDCLVLWAEDNSPCLTEEGVGEGLCFEGLCESFLEDGLVFFTDFEELVDGFDLVEPWEIDGALPSQCSAQGIDDPASDLSGENGALAGLLIGACLPADPFTKSCLTTPMIDLPLPGTLTLSYWEIVDLPEGIARGSIELFSGDLWQEIHEVSPDTPEWTEQIIPLGAIDEPAIQLRFCFESAGEADLYSGWSIDELQVTCLGCAP